MYNLRYHIASLVAVFLALALGLILGGLVVQRGTIEKQQGALVEGLRKEFATLRSENTQLTAENQRLSEFGGALTDDWVAGRLDGQTIIVVTNAGRENGVDAAKSAIEDAGGTVATAIVLKPGLGLDDESIRSKVASLVVLGDDPLASVAASLAAEWSTATADRPLTAALVEAEALRVDDLARNDAADGLVDLAVDGEEPEAAGIAFALAILDHVPAAAAQPLTEDTGVAAAATEAGVSAFDTLGTDIGRYTLVALLSGAKPGSYGLATGAVAPFPQPASRP